MKKKIRIDLKTGRKNGKSEKYKEEVRKLLEKFLTEAGFSGNFSGIMTCSVRGTNHTKRISVERFCDSSVCICVKPGGNDSRRVVFLNVPPSYIGRAEDFFMALRKAT